MLHFGTQELCTVTAITLYSYVTHKKDIITKHSTINDWMESTRGGEQLVSDNKLSLQTYIKLGKKQDPPLV